MSEARGEENSFRPPRERRRAFSTRSQRNAVAKKKQKNDSEYMRRAHHVPPRRRRSARVRLLVLVCAAFALVYGSRVARDAARRREDAAALDRLDRLDPRGSLRAQWERRGADADDAAVLSPHCEASLASILPIDFFALDEPHASRDGTTDRERVAGLKKENTLARSRLYSDFARGVAEKGVTAFAGTTTTQGLRLSSLFRFDSRTGKASAILEPLSIPVRAIVVPLPGDSPAATKIRRETRDALRRFFPPAGGDFGHGDSVWFQDPELFHFSVFHASHHLEPVPASPREMADELDAVRRVAALACPMDVVVERVVVSPSGAVMALWNVLSDGAEPGSLRDSLREALPNAPEKQIVADRVIWHSTVARLLRPPATAGDGGAAAALAAQNLLTEKLCGTRARLNKAWFVHERDKLALALGGRFETFEAHFGCRE